MGSLAALVPGGERALVRAKAARLHLTADGDADPATGPRSSPRLRRRTCFVVAAIAPHLPHERLSVLVRHALWSFRLDDRIEALARGPDPVTGVARLRDAVAAVAAGAGPADGDPLLADLARTVRELSRYDPTGALPARFAGALRDVLTAELRRLRCGWVGAGAATPRPTVERYLDLAADTVNYRSFAYALLAVTAPAPAGSRVDRLDPALRHAARAVRLGNDLRSLARDRADATLNVLDLRTADGAPVTRRLVADEIARYVRAHDRLLATLTGRDPAAPALRRCLRVSVGLYRLTDLR
jgi:hypothetical protein